MNLLLIHQAFVSGGEAGGTRHYEFGQYLAAHGDRLTVVTSTVNYLTGRPYPAARGKLLHRERVDGLEVLRAYAPAVHHRSFPWRIVAFLTFAATSVWAGLRAGPVDLVMGTSPPIFQALSAWVVARLRRRPFLLEVRDLWPEFAIDMGVLRSRALIALARGLERFLYRRADHLLVNSPAYRDYLMEKGVPEAKISLVANGVDAAMFDPEASGAALRGRFGVADKFLVVYAGALGMANDLGTALRAADLLRDRDRIHFLFVGDGKERANLEQEARRLALPNVTFAEPVPKDQMREVLAAADAGLAILMNIAMFRTTFPNKVFDYMAAGRPTVLAIDGVIRRVIEEAEGGLFVPPGDPGALAAAVERLAGDEALADRMGRSARRYVVAHFDRKALADAFHQLTRRLADRGRRPPRLRTRRGDDEAVSGETTTGAIGP
jgi:glycosyltransferase involved in cell wall biosynthesis